MTVTAPDPTGNRSTTSDSSPDAERALIGSILYTRGRSLDHLDFNPEDYSEPRYEQVHTICQRLRDRGIPVDPTTVDDKYRQANEGRSVVAELHALMELPSSSASAEHYARIVTEYATRRNILEMTAKARHMVTSGADPDTVLAEAHQMIDRVRTRAVVEEVHFIGETLGQTIDSLTEAPRHVATPWVELDDKIGGYRPGALYVVGARPGVGKSLFALESALGLSRHGAVALFSMEMPEREVHQRAISRVAHIDAQRVMGHNLDDQDWQRLERVVGRLEQAPIGVRDGAATIPQIRRYAAALNARKPLAGIIVDYLQLIRGPEGDRRNRNEVIQEISQTLKELAIRLDIPVIALAQLNRSGVNEGKPPQVHHLRDSGSVEQDADVVMLLHRTEDEPWDIEIGIGKNRHGPTGHLKLDFKGHYSHIASPSQRGT